jgi:hypothetical protein
MTQTRPARSTPHCHTAALPYHCVVGWFFSHHKYCYLVSCFPSNLCVVVTFLRGASSCARCGICTMPTSCTRETPIPPCSTPMIRSQTHDHDAQHVSLSVISATTGYYLTKKHTVFLQSHLHIFTHLAAILPIRLVRVYKAYCRGR